MRLRLVGRDAGLARGDVLQQLPELPAGEGLRDRTSSSPAELLEHLAAPLEPLEVLATVQRYSRPELVDHPIRRMSLP